MSESLMERAARFLATKQCATALAIVPLAALLARPQRATATVLFSFTSASSGLSDPGPAPVNVSASSLPNGGLRLTGAVGPLTGADYYGGFFVGAYGGGYNFHFTGNLAGTLNAGDVLTLATALSVSATTGNLSVGHVEFKTSAGVMNAWDAAPPALAAGSFQENLISAPAPYTLLTDGNTWQLEIGLVWTGYGPTDTLNLTIPSNSIDIVTAPSPAGTWVNPVGGSWAVIENWSATTPAFGSASSATFTNAITAPQVVTLDQTTTVGKVTFKSLNAYTIAPGASNFALVLNNGTAAALITVLSGNHTISAPISFTAQGLTLSVASSSTLSLAASISGPGLLSLLGAGNVALLPSSGAAKITALSLEHTGSGSSATYSPTLDLADNKLIVQSSGVDKAAKIADLNAAISAGSNGATWTGHGLTSSTAAQDPNRLGVGLFDNAILQKTSFGGQPTDTNSILIAVAHLGDANRNGIVDIQDISIIANNWQQPRNNWARGDLNRDGFVNIQDSSIVANNWQLTSIYTLEPDAELQIVGHGLPASAPEPASLLFLAPISILASRTRRKRR